MLSDQPVRDAGENRRTGWACRGSQQHTPDPFPSWVLAVLFAEAI